jgi:SAM-dependent methyltransferase
MKYTGTFDGLGTNHYQPFVGDSDFWTCPDEKYLVGKCERSSLDRVACIRDILAGTKVLTGSGTALDIGCNIGLFTFLLQSIGLQATGVDNSAHVKVKKFTDRNSIEVANALKAIYGMNPTFVDGDYLDFLSGKSFDVTLYLSVWHHHFIGYGSSDFQRYDAGRNEAILRKVFDSTRSLLIFEYDPGFCCAPFNDLGNTIKLLESWGATVRRIDSSGEKSGVVSYSFKRSLLEVRKNG